MPIHTATSPGISTEELYDRNAGQWSRQDRLLLSDFTARPRVIEVVGDVRDQHLLDLGCGEGFVGRQLARSRPRRIDGFDVSGAMIEAARQAAGNDAAETGGPLHYQVADLSDPSQIPATACDGAIAVFLFNYLTIAAMTRVLQTLRAAIRPGGFFVFTVPHPSLAFLRPVGQPFYFDPGHHHYLQSSDCLFEGRIWRRDGGSNPVRALHKTLSDYMQALEVSGWHRLPRVEELGVSEEHLEIDRSFFTPLIGQPLHLLFRLER